LGKPIRRLGCLALCLCLAGGALAVTRNTWLRWLGEYLTYTEPPCKADTIVVLAGDNFGFRIVKAGELIKEGWAPGALVSGAGYYYGLNEGEVAIQFAVRAGYAGEKFFNVQSPARSTQEEARYMVQELRRRGVHRFILVTSDFHTRRASEIYRKAAADIPFCVVGSRDNDFSPDGWWHTREGRKTAFTEWLKTIAHFLGI
jgi:uncharacterized SAM-binding protein YcdF (DUF218 family)